MKNISKQWLTENKAIDVDDIIECVPDKRSCHYKRHLATDIITVNDWCSSDNARPGNTGNMIISILETLWCKRLWWSQLLEHPTPRILGNPTEDVLPVHGNLVFLKHLCLWSIRLFNFTAIKIMISDLWFCLLWVQIKWIPFYLLLIDAWFLLNTRLCWVVTWVSEPIMIHCVSRAESWEYGKQFQWSHDKTCSAQQTWSTNQARPVIFSQQCPVYVSGKLFCDHLFNKNYFTLDCQILCPRIFILLMTTRNLSSMVCCWKYNCSAITS